MKKGIYRLVLTSLSLSLSLFFIVLIPNQINSQTTVKISNINYFEENGSWYTTDSVTDEKFKVNTRSMTVKLNDENDRYKLLELCKKHKIKIENENILGYYDLVIPENLKFYDAFAKFNESKFFSSIEITSYAKLLGSDDPGFPSQYYLDNSDGDPDINIEAAWAIETGSSSVIIAVIDEGVDKDNTDIDANIWSSYGWDYVGTDSNPDPSNEDEHHGTSVAGIIAAETNNGSAVAGIAGGWNSAGCKIMSLRVFGYENNDYTEATEYIDDAIIFAANNGAKIINMSFAVYDNILSSYQSSIDAAIEYAYKSKGCLLVASSGNVIRPSIYYPARNPNVIAVGGITKDWTKYGGYGSELEIVAPSKGIFSLLNSYSQVSDNWGLFDGITGNGTSASAPQVAGVAALIFSKYPNWLNYDIRKILNESAMDLGDELKFGNGLLQANEALLQANPTYQAANNQPQNVILSGSYGSNPIIQWNEVTGGNIEDYNIYRAKIVDGSYKHFQKVASVYHSGNTTNSWTDNSVIRLHPSIATSTHFYRVTSIDYDYVESVTSNEVSTGSNWASKMVSDENEQVVTYKYCLEDNFPNPFNPSTTIKYELSKKSHVLITIFNSIGEKVTELVNKSMNEGKYQVNFDASNLSSGMYFYSIVAGEFRSTKKMILIK
jgi:subtilisin family serine protease